MSDMLAGIDVSRAQLRVAVDRTHRSEGDFPNDAKGHKALAKWLKKGTRKTVRVVLEPTGVYSLDVAMALAGQGIEVMVANPREVHAFARVVGQRGKSDPLDARLLLAFGKVRPFRAFIPPEQAELELRQLARTIDRLVRDRTRGKNRLHAANATTTTAELLREDIACSIDHLDERIERLQKAALAHIAAHPNLAQEFTRLQSIPGVGQRAGIMLLGELVILPPDLDVKQLVAMAGLDPRPKQSGTMRGRTPISKQGNRHLRSALFMPALAARRSCEEVARFADRVLSRPGKTKLEANVAVMRKLLHAIHGMRRSDTFFDASRFCGPTTPDQPASQPSSRT